MENNQNYNELEVLHSQMEDFKAQLNQQKIVNEKLIIRSMKKSMSWIKKYIYFEFCLIPVIAIMWLGIKEFAHLSWFNYLFVMAIVVLTTISKLTRMKRQRSIQMILFMPAFVVWLLWSGVEAWTALPADAPDFVRGAVYGGLVGGVIGGVVGLVVAFRIFFKMQRTNDEVISQINELNA